MSFEPLQAVEFKKEIDKKSEGLNLGSRLADLLIQERKPSATRLQIYLKKRTEVLRLYLDNCEKEIPIAKHFPYMVRNGRVVLPPVVKGNAACAEFIPNFSC